MISQTELLRIRALKSCSIIEFKFSRMEKEAAILALGFLRRFLQKHNKKLLRVLTPLPEPTQSDDPFGHTFKLELLEDAEKNPKVRVLQAFLVTFFTDPGVTAVKIIDRK